MKVLFITNLPSPYRVDFFNELGKYCELTVLYERSSSAERDSKWVGGDAVNYNAVFLKGINVGVDKAFCPNIGRYLKKGLYDYIVICGIASPAEIMAITICRMRNIEYCLESDGSFKKDRTGFNGRLKAAVLRFLTAKVKYYFSTGEFHDESLISDGVSADRLRRYPFTSIHERDILASPLSAEEKKQYKQIVGIDSDFMVLSVGQFIHRKGFDLLLESAAALPENISICIVGGKPTSEYQAIISKYNIKNVVFVDFMPKDILRNYYLAADIFVLPTREDIWGLVVNEAMALGLPVVTTSRCGAGLELVKGKETGYVVDSDDSCQITAALSKLITNADLRVKMSENALNLIHGYTIERMATNHIQSLK